mmetsp:Transcript_37159/g.62497  ORF Transcript_37159/g.62497 Transcript_37159/m.62497 type:complete len:725 (-) Transcript_37159:355-2529(-)
MSKTTINGGSSQLHGIPSPQNVKNIGAWSSAKVSNNWGSSAASTAAAAKSRTAIPQKDGKLGTKVAASSSATGQPAKSATQPAQSSVKNSGGTTAKAESNNPSSFVLYQSNGLLGWPNATGAASINGLGTLPSALPTINFQVPQVNGIKGNNSTTGNMAQAMRMLNNFHPANLYGGQIKRFNRTPVACVVCHKAKSTCDSNRPCARCSRLGKAHLCKDRPHKKKGRPPKKRSSSDSTAAEPKAKRKATVKKEAMQAAAAGASSVSSNQTGNLSKSMMYSSPTASRANSTKQDSKTNASLQNNRSGGTTGSSSLGFKALGGNSSSSFRTSSGKGSNDAKGQKFETMGRSGQESASKRQATRSANDFSNVVESVDRYLWEEVIDDMSSFFIKHPEVLSSELAALYAGANSRTVMDLPPGCQVLSPLFCMYLTYMSYYLEPEQFTNLQKRLAKLGVIIPNLDTCPLRKFETSVAKTVKQVKAIAPVFRFRWCRKKPSVAITRDLNFPMATMKVSFYRSTNPRTFLLFVRVNEEFENIFGYSQADVVQMSDKPFYYRLIHPKDWKKQLSLEMSMLLNKRRRFNTFITCMRKWKEEICCLETFQFSFNNQDLMTHFTITFSPLPKYLFEKETTSHGPKPPPNSKFSSKSSHNSSTSTKMNSMKSGSGSLNRSRNKANSGMVDPKNMRDTRNDLPGGYAASLANAFGKQSSTSMQGVGNNKKPGSGLPFL